MNNITLIKPKKVFHWEDLKEIWRYRELLYFLSWRDFKVRYKQTVLGALWAILQPFLAMVVFTIFFGNLAKIPSEGIPYPIFVYSGLLFWQFFSGSLTEVSNSLVANTSILTKVYFPRIILPISIVMTKFIDFFIAALILVGMMFYYVYFPQAIIVLVLPLLLLITFLAAVGLGLLLASLNVKYRDVRYVLPFFIQLLLFLTPVIYPSSLAGQYSWLLNINPMTGVVEAARATLFTQAAIDWQQLQISFLIAVALFLVGVISFKKIEPALADVI